MKGKAIGAITVSLMLMASLAVAQGPPTGTPPGGEADRAAAAAYDECRRQGGSEEECHQEVCEEHPDAARCRDDGDDGPPANNTRPGANATHPTPTARPMPFGDGPESFDGRFIAATADADNLTFANYTVSNRTVIASITYQGGPERVAAGWRGASYVVHWDSDRLQFLDNPTGHVSYRTPNGTPMEWVFPDDAVIARSDDGARISYGDQRATLVAPNATWSGELTVVSSHGLSLHLVQPEPSQDNATTERPDPRAEQAHQERQDQIQDAIADRRVAAQVSVRGPSSAPGLMTAAHHNGVEVTDFDSEVNVQVEAPARITAEDVLRVTVSASLPEGRTIVLDIDPEMLAGPDLELRYSNVRDDGVRTEVVFRQADSLHDILDPTDDDGQPEYWVVHDANGLQILVSIPHWSTHEITLASIGEFLTQPSILVGAAAGVIGVLVAAAIMMWPRRRDLA